MNTHRPWPDATTVQRYATLPLQPSDQDADDIALRIATAVGALSGTLATAGRPTCDDRRPTDHDTHLSAFHAALHVPDPEQVALTRFAIGWLMTVADPRHSGAAAARQLADTFLAESSVLERPMDATPPRAD